MSSAHNVRVTCLIAIIFSQAWCQKKEFKSILLWHKAFKAERLDVHLIASEFHMAYLPSSLISRSSAAMQFSNSSKTDRHSQPFFLPNCCCCAILLSGCLSTTVSLKRVLLYDGPGFIDRMRAIHTTHYQQQSHQSDHKSNCQISLLRAIKERLNRAPLSFCCCVETTPNFKLKVEEISRDIFLTWKSWMSHVKSLTGGCNSHSLCCPFA